MRAERTARKLMRSVCMCSSLRRWQPRTKALRAGAGAGGCGRNARILPHAHPQVARGVVHLAGRIARAAVMALDDRARLGDSVCVAFAEFFGAEIDLGEEAREGALEEFVLDLFKAGFELFGWGFAIDPMLFN